MNAPHEHEHPVRYQVSEEIMTALMAADAPMTANDLLDHCQTAESADRISKTLYSLKKRGAIEEGDPISTPAGARKTYRIPAQHTDDDVRLMEHLEADLDTAAITSNGDEWHVTADPILSALSAMRHEPRITDGHRHVERLRALAQHLDDGKTIYPQMDLVAWLFDLAAEIEEMAA